MKKFYTVFLAVVASLLLSPAALANLQFTINCDHDGAIEWSSASYGPWETLSAGDNEIDLAPGYEWNGTEYYYFYVQVKDGFLLNEFKSENVDWLGVNYPDGQNYYSPTDTWNGEVFHAVTTDLAEVRTSKVNVAVEGSPSKVKFKRKGTFNWITLESSPTEIAFDPENELPLEFLSPNKPFYSFKVAGAEFNSTSNDYEGYHYVVTPADGDQIDVVSEWPTDFTTDVTINLPAGMEASVKNVSVSEPGSYSGSTNVDFKLNEAFQVPGGKNVVIEFDTNAYTLNSVKVNDKTVSISSNLTVFAGTDPVVVDVDVTERQVLKFVIHVDEDGVAEVDATSGYGYAYVPLVKGDNVIVPTESYWGGYNTVYLKALYGFKLTRVYCEETGDEIAVPTDPTASVSMYPGDSWLGRVYNVEASNLDDLRAASVNMTITDDPSKISRAQRGTSEIDLSGVQAGETFVVKFDPATESEFTLGRSDVPLKSVKVNGKVVERTSKNSTTHIFTVADGDNIEVTADYGNQQTPVFIVIPEEARGALRSIQYGEYPYSTAEIEWTGDEGMTMIPAGSSARLQFNIDDYMVKTVTIDGVSGDQYNNTFYVLDTAVDIEIDAATYGMLKYTINVTDPSFVVVHAGEYSYSPTVELTGTTNELEISEKTGAILIEAASGCVINSVTDADGNAPATVGWNGAYKVTDGAVFNIEAEKLVEDAAWVLWVEDIEGFNPTYGAPYWRTQSGDNTYFTGGYSVNSFASKINPQISFSGSLYGSAWFYLNDEEPTTNSYYVFYSFYPKNGDVIRLYTSSEATTHGLTFKVEGDAAAELAEGINVTTDIIRSRAEWKDGLTLHKGTQVDIEMPEDAENLKVQLDGEDLTPAENGKYSFVTTGEHSVSISSSSAIIDIEAETPVGNGAVYNLMGVKVLDNATKADLKALTPGVYVVNGQKVVIR